MDKSKGKVNIGKLVIIFLILGAMLVAFYYYVGERMGGKPVEDATKVSKTQKVLQSNLERSYPPTPKEVVKLFSEISQCFYNEETTDDELTGLAELIQILYDEELIANQTPEEYIKNLRSDVDTMKKDQYTISSYSTSASTDVEYFDSEGREWAKLYCNYNLRKGSKLYTSNMEFLLRKDEGGRWKIFGWQMSAD